MNIAVYRVHGTTHGGAEVSEFVTDVNLAAALSLEQQLRQEEQDEEKEEFETEHGPLFGVEDNGLQNEIFRIAMRYILTENFGIQCYNMAKCLEL